MGEELLIGRSVGDSGSVAFQHGRTTPKSYAIRTLCPFHLSYDLVAASSQVFVQPGQDYKQIRAEHEGMSGASEENLMKRMLQGIPLGTQIALILRGQQP